MFTSTPKAIKASDEVSKKTLKNRSRAINEQIKFASGASPNAVAKQTSMILKELGVEEQKKILQEADIPLAEVSAEKMVTLKCDMKVAWNKLNVLHR